MTASASAQVRGLDLRHVLLTRRFASPRACPSTESYKGASRARGREASVETMGDARRALATLHKAFVCRISDAVGRSVAAYPPAGCSPVLRRGGDGTFKGRVVRFAFRGQFDRLRAICRGFTDCRMLPTVQKRGGDEAFKRACRVGSRFAVNLVTAGRPVAAYPSVGCSPVLRRGGDGTFKGRVVRFAFRGQFGRLRANCRGFAACRMFPTVRKRGGDEALRKRAGEV